MADPRPVTIGEELDGIPASGWNAFYETWKKVNQLQLPNTRVGQQIQADRVLVAVFNTEEALIDVDFPILKLSGPSITPDDRQSCLHQPASFNGETPDDSTEEGNFVIVQGPIGAGDAGRGKAVLLGYSFVEIEWTDETHEFAAVKSGDNEKLKSAASGIRVLWHQEIPDPEYLPATLFALVLLGGGGGSTSIARHGARVVSAVTAASDNLQVNWGVGSVRPMDDTTGILGDPVTVVNPLQLDFDIDFYVEIDDSTPYPKVWDGSCEVWSWAEDET